MFRRLVEILEEHGNGVRAYEECARAAQDGVRDKPELAACYFLLGAAAQRFVDTYHGEPLTSGRAEEQLKLFESYAKELEGAFSNGSAEDRVATLNAVAGKILG